MLTALREHGCVQKAMLIQSDEHATLAFAKCFIDFRPLRNA
jgi:hypothetical protein